MVSEGLEEAPAAFGFVTGGKRELLNGEGVVQLLADDVDGGKRHVQDSMRWQNAQARIFQAGAEHEHAVPGMSLCRMAYACLLALRVSIAKSGLVSMVAVGDEQRPGFQRRDHLLNQARMGDCPQPLAESIVVFEVDAWLTAGNLLFDRQEDAALWVRKKAENGAEVRSAGLQEIEPVGLRRRPSHLMGEHCAGTEFLQLHQ